MPSGSGGSAHLIQHQLLSALCNSSATIQIPSSTSVDAILQAPETSSSSERRYLTVIWEKAEDSFKIAFLAERAKVFH